MIVLLLHEHALECLSTPCIPPAMTDISLISHLSLQYYICLVCIS